MQKSILIFTLFILYTQSIPFGKWYFHHKKYFKNYLVKDGGPAPQYIEQRVDNFDGQNTKTYQQRYYVNDTFWQGSQSGAPVFLYVDGEGPGLSGYAVVEGNIVEQAAKHGALILGLEHRYYGQSLPTEDFSNENLRYLSAHQALADAASFINKMNRQYNLTKQNKWITFGGSYPGMLSSWLRLKFPHLVHGSISNSGPVLPQTNFQGYLDVVQEAYEAQEVGGSQECRQLIEQGHYQIGQLLKTQQGRQLLSNKFNICPSDQLTADQMLEDKDNQATFAGFGVGPLGGLPQYNDPACNQDNCNIQKVCQFLLSPQSGNNPLDKLASLSKSDECTNVDYKSQLSSLANTSIQADNSWIRIWTYQTCTEFAFYQTCDEDSNCPFTKGLNDLEYQLKPCLAAFNITPDNVVQRVQFSAAYWGANQPQGSRVLYTNGQVDPWHYLSVIQSPDPSNLQTQWVITGSHCQWMSGTRSTDNKYLLTARKYIGDTINKWLNEGNSICPLN